MSNAKKVINIIPEKDLIRIGFIYEDWPDNDFDEALSHVLNLAYQAGIEAVTSNTLQSGGKVEV